MPAFWDNVKNGRYSISDVTPDRWDPALYYDPDHNAPDKTYSKIGGWVREYAWDPMKWRLPIPPRVADAMDGGQKWAIACTREALEDYGYPERPLDPDRTAVILGNAMAGEKHYLTSLRIYFPEYAHELAESASFAALPAAVRRDITRELHQRIGQRLPEITEDTHARRIGQLHCGPNRQRLQLPRAEFIVDAACASAMAAISSAVEGLVENDFDVAITGGIDRNMGASTFVKFCKIGALSATGTRPYAEGADGFVMGEGAAHLLLKRLADAERDGDKIYAVLRGIGGSSDGKGKGITAPNPVGQKFCHRARLGECRRCRLPPRPDRRPRHIHPGGRCGRSAEHGRKCSASFIFRLGSVALGSVKSNIGHLKGAAGAAGLLKAALALRDKVLPPSLQCERPNPDIDFAHSPALRQYRIETVGRAGRDACGAPASSAFGFGGTNFHVVLEEYIPQAERQRKAIGRGGEYPDSGTVHKCTPQVARAASTAFLQSAVARRAGDRRLDQRPNWPSGCARSEGRRRRAAHRRRPRRLNRICGRPNAWPSTTPTPPIWRTNQPRLSRRWRPISPAFWKALRAQGIFRGHGRRPRWRSSIPAKVRSMSTCSSTLRAAEPIVAETFAEADRVMTPLLGKPLSEFIFVDPTDADAVAKAEEDLRQTDITQPAVLAIDTALTRLLGGLWHPARI